jgi:ribose transport system ATP-binding protein
MNILVGALRADRGQIWIHGQQVHFAGPREAIREGIAIIRQEFDLVPWLSVADNIFLGREPSARGGIIDQQSMRRESQQILNVLGVPLDVDLPVALLSSAQQQVVEIAKALSLRADLIVMDEPSTGLAERELARLFEIARGLREQGKTVIYISHRLDEVFEVCDRATVLQDGCYVGTVDVAEVTRAELIGMMVGEAGLEGERRMALYDPQRVLLEAKGLTRAGVIYDINLKLHEGEVLGLAGLMGAGKSSVSRALFGGDRADAGEVQLRGSRLTLGDPRCSIQAGIVLVPEDRRTQGLFARMSIVRNVAMPQLERLSPHGVVSALEEQALAEEAVQRFDIKTTSLQQIVHYLSGGNQQKVVLGKWLLREPQVVILDEPTRGIDVATKEEVYRLVDRLARQGVGVIVASSELPELLRLCDSIVVLFEGRIMGVLSSETATQQKILTLASGVRLAAPELEG